MSIFTSYDNKGATSPKDSLGGYEPLASDIYEAEIKAAYVTTSRSGAATINLVLDIAGREYHETIYFTNSKGETFFLSKQSGEKISLPGYTTFNDLCLCAVGKEVNQLESENRTFKIYDVEAKKVLPKEVPTAVELIGKKVAVGILHEIVDKTAKNDDGAYVPTGETREQNVIDKVFDLKSHKTVNEARENATEATFYDLWLDKNKDQIRKRVKGKAGATEAKAEPKKATKPLFS